MQNNTYERLMVETQEKSLVIFGCGKYFEDFLSHYPTLSEKIAVILDNGKDRDEYICNGVSIPIIVPEEMKRIDIKEYIIVFCASRWRGMKKQLDDIMRCDYIYFHYPLDVDYRKDKELGINHRIIVPAVRVLKEHSTVMKASELTGAKSEDELIKRLKTKEIHTIPRLVVVLTPKCSMRCMDCCNLMWAFSGKVTGGGA